MQKVIKLTKREFIRDYLTLQRRRKKSRPRESRTKVAV